MWAEARNTELAFDGASGKTMVHLGDYRMDIVPPELFLEPPKERRDGDCGFAGDPVCRLILRFDNVVVKAFRVFSLVVVRRQLRHLVEHLPKLVLLVVVEPCLMCE